MLRPIDTTFAVNDPNRKVFVRLPLRAQSGELVYTLFCRGGVEPYISEGAPADVWVVEPFACRLNEGARESEETLLATDESPYWYTDGRVVEYRELAIPAKRRRVFRTRGFELALRFLHVAFAGDSIRRFDLRVTVRPDKHITSRFVEGNPHPMCRNWTDSTRLGSWEPCPKH
ncbi:MAG TPA: hypothetical protein VM716_04990 [Gemmatimonadales bacterium]|nr:hypothetical protein [Gemmatimonadales bacterium]